MKKSDQSKFINLFYVTSLSIGLATFGGIAVNQAHAAGTQDQSQGQGQGQQAQAQDQSGSGSQQSQQQARTMQQASSKPTTPDDIRDNVNSYLDRNVQVQGKVARVISPNAFVLEGKDQKNLLVVSKSLNQETSASAPLPLVKKGDSVKLSGKVTQLTVTDAINVYGSEDQPLAAISSTNQIPAVQVAPMGVRVQG